MQVLLGLGKTAALYVYPYESHAPAGEGILPGLVVALAGLVRSIREAVAEAGIELPLNSHGRDS